ncbi:MAG: ABC transporter ATP-binding protein [Eubacteriaceae bacterium]|nr:ABC transporter ATP-binding protein [Eubacteriaceae bacterium]
MENLLEVKNLKLYFNGPYGRVPAVRGVSLSVRSGETVALVGESGCGKTAFCRSILRLHSDHAEIDEESSIILCGREITEMTDEEMEEVRGRDAAMVFQDPMTSLNPVFSIGSQITESIMLHDKTGTVSKKQSRERAVELLEQAGIDRAEIRFDQYPHQFSGGMRQRAAIAIALACDPKLLIADEPTTSLDTDTQDKIVELLRQLAGKTDRGTIFVTHDLGLAADLADRIAVMKDGVVVEEGVTEEIFDHPQHEYTKKLLGYADYGKGKGHRHGQVHYHNGTPHSHDAETYGKKPLMEIRDLSKSFEMGRHRTNRVLEGLDMDVYKGEILGIVGNSGCGKSTLARCIMDIYKPDRGTVRMMEKCSMQMIFQDSASAFDPRMTLGDIIAEPLAIKKVFYSPGRMAEKVAEMMELAGLERSLADRHPYDVSGGQRQRAAIARALITDPDFIIADEPISSLDVSIQAQIIHLLKKLHDEKNLTMIIIAHDIPMVAHISDRIIKI